MIEPRVQFIVTPSGERLVVMPEADYDAMIDEIEEHAELRPEFLEEIERRRAALDAGEPTIPLEELIKRRHAAE